MAFSSRHPDCADGDLEQAIGAILARARPTGSVIHGFTHWAIVERNGLYIAGSSGADRTVVRLFAYLHDIRRVNDGIDPGHGRRGAEVARGMRDELGLLPDESFERLCFACTHHTDRVHHEDPTVATCWDADRLDLGRVGITPHPDYLNTAAARDLAASGDFDILHSLHLRTRHTA